MFSRRANTDLESIGVGLEAARDFRLLPCLDIAKKENSEARTAHHKLVPRRQESRA